MKSIKNCWIFILLLVLNKYVFIFICPLIKLTPKIAKIYFPIQSEHKYLKIISLYLIKKKLQKLKV